MVGGEGRGVPDAAPAPLMLLAVGAAAEEGSMPSGSDGGDGALDAAAAATSSPDAMEGNGDDAAAEDDEEQEEPFFRKDANDVLLMDGPRLLRAYIGPLALQGPTPGTFALFWRHCHRRPMSRCWQCLW